MWPTVILCVFAWVLFVMVTNTATQSAKDNVPTSDNPSGTKQYAATTPDVPVREVAPDFTFAVWDANGKICILAKFKASFQITYESTRGQQTVSVNLPGDAHAKGRCGTFYIEPSIELSWPGFRLILTFTVVNPKEKHDTWELLTMELTYDAASPIFDGATNAGKWTARNLEDGLFTTPYVKSYCFPSTDDISLYNSKKERVVLARMKDIRLQVYDVHDGKFSTCAPVRDVAPDFTFAVWDDNGKICILAKFTASFQITYESRGGEQNVSVNLPEYAQAKGRCGTFDKEPSIEELSWHGFRLVMTFTAVNPKENEDSWELLAMDFSYDTWSSSFDYSINPGIKTARNFEGGLFATQYGKSYFCSSPEDISLYDSKKERVVLVRMKDVRLQVYDVHDGKFSPWADPESHLGGGSNSEKPCCKCLAIYLISTYCILILVQFGYLCL